MPEYQATVAFTVEVTFGFTGKRDEGEAAMKANDLASEVEFAIATCPKGMRFIDLEVVGVDLNEVWDE